MPGQDVEFSSNGGSTNGYLATPQSGSGPGVIVVQEWWGLNDQIRRAADRFAQEGFVALAPDFYHGEGARIGEPDAAGKLLMALDIDRTARDARGAAQYLRTHPATRGSKVGVIGYCMGGQLALLAGTVAPDEIGAVIDMYGIHPNVHPDFSKMKAPVSLLFAALDSSVDGATLEQQLRRAGVQFESHTYPGVDHAFMNDERTDVYDKEASEDAWRRTVSFFHQHLGG